MRHNEKYICPECVKEHNLTFDFFTPEDGDEKSEVIECDCGCEFKVGVEAMVEIYFDAIMPKVIKSGKNKLVFSIMDTSTWPQENNPKQFSIF